MQIFLDYVVVLHTDLTTKQATKQAISIEYELRNFKAIIRVQIFLDSVVVLHTDLTTKQATKQAISIEYELRNFKAII